MQETSLQAKQREMAACREALTKKQSVWMRGFLKGNIARLEAEIKEELDTDVVESLEEAGELDDVFEAA